MAQSKLLERHLLYMRRPTAHPLPALLAIGIAGTLASISPLFGAEAAEPAAVFTSTVSAQSDAPEFDLAKLHARARVIYVSSGAQPFAVRMIDSDGRTAFRFSGSDFHPTVIVELAHTEKLHRVTAAFPAEATRLDVYLTNELPRDRADFRFLTPVASVVDFDGDGKAVVDFAPQDVRYVALRWTRQAGSQPFKVTEISAFGGVALSFVELDPGTPLPSESLVVLPTVPVVSPN
jgi:hypothetical protein